MVLASIKPHIGIVSVPKRQASWDEGGVKGGSIQLCQTLCRCMFVLRLQSCGHFAQGMQHVKVVSV